VIVQTFVPDHYAVRPVETHDYETFYAQEMAHRATLGFPPLGSLANVMVSAESELEAVAAAEAVARAVADGGSGAEVLGPAPAPLPRLRGRFRWQLLLKGDEKRVRDAARAALGALAKLQKPGAGVQGAVDVRPWSML
jgi:primosomal protein N' (replication factor Y)